MPCSTYHIHYYYYKPSRLVGLLFKWNSRYISHYQNNITLSLSLAPAALYTHTHTSTSRRNKQPKIQAATVVARYTLAWTRCAKKPTITARPNISLGPPPRAHTRTSARLFLPAHVIYSTLVQHTYTHYYTPCAFSPELLLSRAVCLWGARAVAAAGCRRRCKYVPWLAGERSGGGRESRSVYVLSRAAAALHRPRKKVMRWKVRRCSGPRDRVKFVVGVGGQGVSTILI